MNTFQSIEVKGERFILVPAGEYERLRTGDAEGLPAMPPEDAAGNMNAKDYITFSIARDIILDRRAAGLSQIELAKLAGVRHETIHRIESGKHCPTVPTIRKIEAALKKAAGRRRRAG